MPKTKKEIVLNKEYDSTLDEILLDGGLKEKISRDEIVNIPIDKLISFKNHPDKESEFKYFLRIHDLKTGKIPAKLRQLEVYAAFFFLEYKIKPEDTEIELRSYQSDDIIVGNPTAKDIKPLMNKIVAFDKRIEKIKLEG